MTPLMHAAYCGHYEACQLLLEKGADVNSDLHSEGVSQLFVRITDPYTCNMYMLCVHLHVMCTCNVKFHSPS